MDIGTIREKLDRSLIPEADRLRREFVGTVPPRLWHYTSGEGLLGIVDSKSFHATDLFYFNDASEIIYASKLVEKVLSGAIHVPDGRILKGVLDVFQRLNSERVYPYSVHVVCFCENGDLLSQWRGYGASGAGYSLGLESEDLAASLTGSDWALYPVRYDEDLQSELIKKSVESLCQTAARATDELTDQSSTDLLVGSQAREYVSYFLLSFLTQLLVAFKAPSFKEEAEWRVVRFVANKDRSPNFRVKHGIIRPYIPWELSKLPLSAIVKGPTLEPDIVVRSLNDLLAHYRYPGVEIKVSKIPLRA